MSREKFEAWGMSDVALRITLESETYAGIAWMAWQAATASLQAERDQLAAECAALKIAAEFATAPDMWEDLGGNVMRYQYQEWYADKLKSAMETPATDRVLAEQRAQGVEMFASEIDQRHQKLQPFSAQARTMKSMVFMASAFAAQLRNEVKE